MDSNVSSGSKAAVDLMVRRVQAMLRARGFHSSRISYPGRYEQRSIDIFAISPSRGRVKLFIKIVDDVEKLPPSEVRDMRKLSEILDASPIVVAKYAYGDVLDDIVVYEKQGMHVLSVEGFERSLDNQIFVMQRQGGYFMRVRGEKLRELRELRGMSLGDVAHRVGVSRRSIYLYEKNAMDVSLTVATKLMEIFGEEIFEPINILEERPPYKESKKDTIISYDDPLEKRILNIILDAVMSALKFPYHAISKRLAHTRSTPIDIALSLSSKKLVFIVEHSDRDRNKTFINKVVEASKITNKYSDVSQYIVVKSREYVRELEEAGLSIHVADDTHGLKKELREHLEASEEKVG